jgi:hypothetical protein
MNRAFLPAAIAGLSLPAVRLALPCLQAVQHTQLGQAQHELAPLTCCRSWPVSSCSAACFALLTGSAVYYTTGINTT